MKIRLIACSLMLAAASATTLSVQAADTKPKKSPEERFARLDANNDGKLSSEEFVSKRKADKKAAGEKQFRRRDANKDGSLSLDEFKTPPMKKK